MLSTLQWAVWIVPATAALAVTLYGVRELIGYSLSTCLGSHHYELVEKADDWRVERERTYYNAKRLYRYECAHDGCGVEKEEWVTESTQVGRTLAACSNDDDEWSPEVEDFTAVIDALHRLSND